MTGPLAGVRVIECDAIGPVPFAAMMLADLGCDVVRLCRPGRGDSPSADGALGRGRSHVTLDLKSEAGRRDALELIAGADILIEGNRPGVMERLGLGPEPCHAVNPGLVYGRMTGWGQDGPLASTAGHDINYLALSGALHAIGPSDRPIPPLNLVGDYGGGAMLLVVGVLAALWPARTSGKGQVVDAAMVDGSALLMTLFYALASTGGWRPDREANLLDGGAPFYRTYACADGGHVAVGAIEPPFFARLLAGLDIDQPGIDQYDRSGWPALAERLAARFATRTRDAWAETFAGTDACVTPVLSMAEAPRNAHNVARGAFTGAIGDGQAVPAPAPRFRPIASPPAAAPERVPERRDDQRWSDQRLAR